VCYRLKRPWPTAGGATELVLDPVDFLRRLARLIPPPKMNLVRYGGAFSSNSSLRAGITPRLAPSRCGCRHAKPASGQQSAKASRAAASTLPGELTAGQLPASAVPSAPVLREQDALLPALLGPALPSEQPGELRGRYLDWASLLRRVYGEDILLCPKCGHRPMRVIAAIDDPPLVNKILVHLGLPTCRPEISKARSPPQLELDDDFGDADLDGSESEFDVN
jgi:hypothetical protein